MKASKTPRAAREAAILGQTFALAQQGKTPWQVLQSIAAHAGLEVHVKGKQLRLLPLLHQQPLLLAQRHPQLQPPK